MKQPFSADHISEVILWGGTGQAKVAGPIIEADGCKVVAVFDHTDGLTSPFKHVPIYYGDSAFSKWIAPRTPHSVGFLVTIGNPHGVQRLRIHSKIKAQGLTPINIVHPRATVAASVQFAEGLQILAGAIVSEEVSLGKSVIINTNASVDHECRLGNGVEIAPGATLCGLVQLGDYSWIGAGATVLPRLKIGESAIVGAGAVVTQDVPDGVTVVGVPARPIKKARV